MAALFDELLFDPLLLRRRDNENFPVTANLEYANSQPRNLQTGVRTTNVGRLDAVNVCSLSVGLLNLTDMDYVNRFLRGGYGSAYGFRAFLPHDYSLNLEPIGTGDGVTTQFKIVRTYKRPGDTTHTAVRRIFKPVVQVGKEKNNFQLLQADGVTSRTVAAGPPNYFNTAFRVFFNNGTNEQLTGWTADARTGIVYFTSAPAISAIILVTCVFDTPMAFDGNQFQMMYDYPSEAQYTMREMLGPELGIT